jgi:hypothetical protein
LFATLHQSPAFHIAPIAGITREALLMAVNPSVPAKTVPEFIAYAMAKPGKLSMASSRGMGVLAVHPSVSARPVAVGIPPRQPVARQLSPQAVPKPVHGTQKHGWCIGCKHCTLT